MFLTPTFRLRLLRLTCFVFIFLSRGDPIFLINWLNSQIISLSQRSSPWSHSRLYIIERRSVNNHVIHTVLRSKKQRVLQANPWKYDVLMHESAEYWYFHYSNEQTTATAATEAAPQYGLRSSVVFFLQNSNDKKLKRDFLVLDLYLKRRKGETRRAAATTRRRAYAESDSRPTFAEGGHQDDGLASHFSFFLDLYRL